MVVVLDVIGAGVSSTTGAGGAGAGVSTTTGAGAGVSTTTGAGAGVSATVTSPGAGVAPAIFTLVFVPTADALPALPTELLV
ncbi:MAG: hypothetical protein DMF58_15335 [Acidobacteria bacterium]|nr:MAG: hypothetical protein DMF58_15335 [Acidobacteriota bacterium]